MMNADDMLKDLYREYNNVVKPLLDLVERETGMVPSGLLSEVRTVHDHVARSYLPDLKEEERCNEVKLAARHNWDIMLDCYKALCLQGEQMQQQFQRDNRKVNLESVDSGRFLPKFTALKDSADDLAEQARAAESYGASKREEALDLYRRSSETYDELRKFVVEQSQNLAWSASYQRIQIGSRLVYTAASFIVGGVVIWLLVWFP